MKILIALLDDPASKGAFDFLLSIVKPTDEVLLLAVAKELNNNKYKNMSQAAAYNVAVQEHLRNVIRKYGREMTKAGIKHTCLLGKGESAKKCICEEADYYDADIVIVGKRVNRKDDLSVKSTSSTSNYVLHNSPCSVIVVKCDAPAPEPTPRAYAEVLEP